jgi:LmbE family N-acetylglucosaminyl deacetylase
VRTLVPSLICSALLAATPAARSRAASGDPLEQFGPTTSLLVVSPHPDDESLCCAGVIQRVRHAGGQVSIVWITSGDGSELDSLVIEKSLFVQPQKMRDLAQLRMREARNAAAILGVPPERQFFLGYPDRGVLAIITDNFVTPYFSRFSGTASVPYPAALAPGHAYTGQNLEHDFEIVLERTRPTILLAPSPRDAHSDHRAAGILTIRAMSRRNELQSVRYWIVHGGGLWPTPRGFEPDRTLLPPPRGRGLPLLPFKLDAAEEEQKFRAVRGYETQMATMSSFLLTFVRTNELYSALPMPDAVAGE